jgi:hypothetical protein
MAAVEKDMALEDKAKANDPNLPDIAMPPPLEAPHMPAIGETELGHARHRQFMVALQSTTNYNNAQLEELASVITGLCANWGIMQV